MHYIGPKCSIAPVLAASVFSLQKGLKLKLPSMATASVDF